MKKNLVMIFGTFDGLHPGHRFLLRGAARSGGKLIAVVARDSVVRRLKKRPPVQPEGRRLRNLRGVRVVFKAVLGDKKDGTYGVIKKYKPDVICLGYDQKWLKRDLRERMSRKKIPNIRLITLSAFKPQKYHSSLIRK